MTKQDGCKDMQKWYHPTFFNGAKSSIQCESIGVNAYAFQFEASLEEGKVTFPLKEECVFRSDCMSTDTYRFSLEGPVSSGRHASASPHSCYTLLRMDLGECPKLHDLALRADYENAAQKKDYFYDVDAMEHLQNFINECDRRTEQAKRRLAETQEELSTEVAAKLNRVHELAEQIGKKLAQAEKLGAEGNVDESMKTLQEVEEFRRQKMLAELEYRNSMPASSYQQQKLRVCDVCSAYLGIHDNDRRLADHFGGKLHLGFITIREKLLELKAEVNEKRQKGRLDRDRDYLREREERSRSDSSRSRRHRSRSSSRHRHRSRSDERRKHGSSRRRHRSSSREHRRSHRRDRSPEHHKSKRGDSKDRRRSHSTGNDKEENNHEA